MFELAAKLNFEGIVSKNAQALIDRSAPKPGSRSNRAEREIPGHWFVKIRYWRGCALSREAKCKDLVYMGKAGTGWSRTVSSQIRKLLS
jgi:bifunctional non-homologous end joining protein LigD